MLDEVFGNDCMVDNPLYSNVNGYYNFMVAKRGEQMSRKSILKQVYLNPQIPKELELLVYYEDKFSSFGGIVKDLLYKQMMLEKGNINIV